MQGADETGDSLLTKPTDAPPSYVMAVHSQQYTPRTPLPLTFSVPATPLSTESETVAANLPPPYKDSVKEDEDNATG